MRRSLECHYLVQTSLALRQPGHDIWRITLTVKDPETGEMGENLLFWEQPRYVYIGPRRFADAAISLARAA
jgi:hypothetical protein